MPPNQSVTNLIHRKIVRPANKLRLEPEFWDYLREIAFMKQVAISTLVSVIN
jgi:predicted DNA-binding ribbon-helix-helix protein